MTGIFTFTEVFTALGDLLMPRECIVCGRILTLRESHICIDCLADLPRTFFSNMPHNQMADRFNSLIQRDLDATGGNGEWKYAANAAGLTGVTQHYGVGTAGLGVFPGGGGQQFNWGLINGMSSPNPAVSGGTFIDNSATFTFTVPANYSATISNVRFQFGTALNEPSITCATAGDCLSDDTPVPEPSTFGVMGLGISALLLYVRRRA